MDPTIAIIIGVIFYKLASLFVGVAFGYMGYRLFLADKERPAASVEIARGGWKLKLERAAPGIFFCAVAAVTVVGTIYRGLDFQRQIQPATQPKVKILPQEPPFGKD